MHAVVTDVDETSIAAPATLDALRFLDESERLWSAALLPSLTCNGSPDSRHRRELALQALAAYEGLREREAPSEPLLVARRWPACTIVTLLSVATRSSGRADLADRLHRAAPGLSLDTWLRGWSDCWATAALRPGPVPGLDLLLAAARPDDVVRAALRLDVDRRTVVVAAPGGSVTAGASGCPATDGGWVLLHPVPVARHRDVLGVERTVPIVDLTDPLLLFDEQGALLDGPTVAPGEVWMLHLGRPGADAFRGDHHVRELAGAPLGWTRWWLARVELGAGAAVRSTAGSWPGAWREVANTAPTGTAALAPVEEVRTASDPEGKPVHARAPHLQLPAGAEWSVDVTGPGTAVRTLMPGGSAVDLAALLPRPAVGRFDVVARTGAQRLRATFGIVEGLRVESPHQVRILDGDGLWHSQLALRAAPGVELPAPTVALRASEIGRTVRMRSPDGVLDVRLQLPHCALRLRRDGANGPWAVTQQVVLTDEIEAGTALDLLLPAQVRQAVGTPHLVARYRDGSEATTLRGQPAGAEVLRFRLAPLVDTVHRHGALHVGLTLGERDLTIAVVRRRPVATGVRMEDGRLHVEGRGAGELHVAVRADHAPWLRPFAAVLAADASSVGLPAAFAEGPVTALLGPADTDLPAFGVPLPSRVRCFRTGDVRSVPPLASVPEAAVAAYLAGVGPLPDGPAVLPLLLGVAVRARAVRGDAAGRAIAQECAMALADHPVPALRAAARFATREVAETLIRSGLAAHRLPDVDNPATVADVMRSAPLAGLLLASPVIPYLADAATFDPAELDTDEARLLAAVQTALPAGSAVVTGRAQPDSSMLPGPIEPWPVDDAELTDAVLALHRLVAGTAAGRLLGVLATDDRPLSGRLSLGCALLARLAAQGDRPAAAAERELRQAWVRLAEQAPARIADDLVRAEMTIARTIAAARLETL